MRGGVGVCSSSPNWLTEFKFIKVKTTDSIILWFTMSECGEVHSLTWPYRFYLLSWTHIFYMLKKCWPPAIEKFLNPRFEPYLKIISDFLTMVTNVVITNSLLFQFCVTSLVVTDKANPLNSVQINGCQTPARIIN